VSQARQDTAASGNRVPEGIPGVISISLVSHGHGRLLASLFNDLQTYRPTGIEVILTLNIQETLPFDPNSFAFPVKLIRNSTPRGFAANHNAAFRAALAADSAHRGARQAMVVLRIERGDLEGASRLLKEALAADASQPDFAVALARIHVERGNLLEALAVLDRAAPAAEAHGELHVLRGTVLQRLGSHAQAADAYRAALRAQTGTPQVWLGLGISLEALQKRPEAAQAFRNALASGPVSAEVRTFAEQRIQALR